MHARMQCGCQFVDLCLVQFEDDGEEDRLEEYELSD